MRVLPEEELIVINRIALCLLAALMAGSVFAQDLTDAQRAALEERIKPTGQSCLEGDSNCGGAAVAVASDGPRSGEEVYKASCGLCHDSGVAGAPKYGDAAGWADRLAKGTDALYASGINGVPGTGMMAKGGCMNCTDEEINAAVDHMLAGSQ
jgi:cytochrome c5